jgi:hypothetical protein
MHPVLSAQLANAVDADRRRQAVEARRAAARRRRRPAGMRAPVQPGMSRSLTSLRRLVSAERG